MKRDVYRAGDGRTATQVPAPVVVFCYSGNWHSGERADYLFVGAALAAQGLIAVLPDYRLYPLVRLPDVLTDSVQAVRGAARHIAAFGGNPQQVFLMGYAAGTYNAAILPLNGVSLHSAGVAVHRLRGLIGSAGPHDFLSLIGPVTRAVFGFPGKEISTQPVHFVSAAAPPALLFTAQQGDLVDPGNTRRRRRACMQTAA
jgi:acetyl esterase/lipase